MLLFASRSILAAIDILKRTMVVCGVLVLRRSREDTPSVPLHHRVVSKSAPAVNGTNFAQTVEKLLEYVSWEAYSSSRELDKRV